jgi:SAM-dependent methyltransferase
MQQQLDEVTENHRDSSLSFVWTRTSIGHFWDLVAKEPRLQNLYFSRQVATYLIHLAQYAGLNTGRVLDYGCGPGYLAKALVESGYDTTALEFSEASAKRVNRLISPAPNWHGCIASQSVPTPLPDAAFSWIFSIETYEHLLDEWIEGYFREMLRLLRPAGQIFLTTPYMEDLDGCLILCPACETRFHRWGHLRSVTRDELISHVIDAGYEVVYCRAIDLCTVGGFIDRPSIRNASIRTVSTWLKAKYHQRLERKHKPEFPNQYHVRTLPDGPHLVLVAKKQC